MEKFISVVIPNYNMAGTIGRCLDAVFSSEYENFEVIVVDDHSDDNSLDIIRSYSCRLIRLEGRSGTSRARNTGALHSRGEIIFFIDADCLLRKDTLSIVNRTASRAGRGAVIGGTYSPVPPDRDFFSRFQSVFVYFSETKKADSPDYIAAHAMAMYAETFRGSSGFPEDFLPIIEDVEFTHRLKRSGYRLLVNPDIQVRHIFGFTLMKSLRNAYRKSKYWAVYSLRNRDFFTDSGSASVELKTNVFSCFSVVVIALLFVLFRNTAFLTALAAVFTVNIVISRGLLRAFCETGGISFAAQAFLYYVLVYPLPVGLGSLSGMIYHARNRTQ